VYGNKVVDADVPSWQHPMLTFFVVCFSKLLMLKANARFEIVWLWLYSKKNLVDDVNYIPIYCGFKMIFEF
jgi:hypothetical protein